MYNSQFQIQKNLELELNAINAPITAQELATVIDKFNSYVSENNKTIIQTKKEVLKQLPNSNRRSRSLISCGNVMGAIGLIHAGSYSAAAYLLGITGPASFIVPLLVSTAYYMASLAC